MAGTGVRWAVRCVYFVALASLTAGLIHAQEVTGSIRGRVTDASGAVVPHARISVKQIETGLTREAVADSDGAYLLVLLPVGHYRLEATARGFQKYVQDGITLSVNQVAIVPVRLAVGSTQQTVEVKANAVLLQTASDLGETVHERDILDLPLNGRNFTQLGLLQPGVVPMTQGLQDAGGPLRARQAYSVNGLPPESNDFLIDGVENYDSVYASYVLEPPIDSIAEFRILTNTASAEFGHSAGSTTNIVTRSGSNQLHGDLYDFLRNNALDSRNFFSQNVEPLKQNQFGGTLGGPIRRDKTFFFGYYEGFRNRQGETFLSTVPSLVERLGDFSQTVDPTSGKVLPLLNEITGEQYPDNQLPSINAISQRLLSYYPLPNTGTNLFATTQAVRSNSDQFGVRIDHYFSSRDSIFVRYNFANGSEFDPIAVSGATVPGFPVQENNRAQDVVIEETRALSPSLVNIARVAFLRFKFLDVAGLNHTPPSSVGFQFPTTLPSQSGLPYIDIPGYGNIGDPLTGPRDSYQDTYTAADSLTWVRNRHELQFGGEFRHDEINALQGIASNGYFVFGTYPVSNSFASFLEGAPEVFLQGGGYLPRGLRGNGSIGYVQDAYKPTQRLTVNVGLRYELTYPFTEIHNQQFLWVPGVQSKVMPNAPVGLLYPGDPGVPAGLIQTDYRGFAPRLGLAWDPTGSGKWVVRSAYGIFYEPYYNGQGGPLQDIISAPPWFKIAQITEPNYADPTAGIDVSAPGFIFPELFDSLDPRMRLPYAQDWNFTVQRAFGSGWLAEVGYVGTKGTKLPRFVEVDPAVYIPGTCDGQPCSTEANVDQRRPHSGCTLNQPESDCLYTSEAYLSGIVNSDYNGLQASLRKRMAHGISFLASYTYSKALDDSSSFNMTGGSSENVAGENDLAQDPFDLEAEYGRSLFDQRHRFVFSHEWQLPSLNHGARWSRQIFNNWQVNGILTLSTGTPFTVYDSSDVSLEGDSAEISGFPSDRPDLIRNPNNGPKTAQEWFNIDAFQRLNPVTQAGQFGDAGRNVTQAAGIATYDFSVFKEFRFTESKTLQFRAELFNIFNHVNFGLPDDDISSPTFGQVESALPPREIQFLEVPILSVGRAPDA